MDKDRWYWWLLNLWMIAVGMGMTWFLCTKEFGLDKYGFLVLPVAALVVGYARTPLTSKRSDGLPVLNRFGLIYLQAWKTVWHSKWILVVFGLSALVAVVAYLAEYGLSLAYHPYAHSGYYDMTGFRFAGEQLGPYLDRLLKHGISDVHNRIPSLFFPSIWSQLRTTFSIGVFALAILVAILWLRPRLKDLPEDSEYSAALGFIRRIGGPLALACLVTFAAGVILEIWGIRQVEGLNSAIMNLSLVVDLLFALLAGVTASGFVVAGVVGALSRTGHDAVTADSFVEDAVRYFRPVAGVYLVLTVAELIVMGVPSYVSLFLYHGTLPNDVSALLLWSFRAWPLVLLALMLAPYASVIREAKGGWTSVVMSLRDWGRNAWDIISMIAVGYSLLIVPVIAVRIIGPISADWVPRGAPMLLIELITWPLFGAVVMVAVWEFYRQIGVSDASDSSLIAKETDVTDGTSRDSG